jgi:predicted alpha/beta hydrolase family esterase
MKKYNMKKIIILCLTLIVSFVGYSQKGFTMKEFGKASNKYWIIIPETKQPLNQNIVVFLHGYGASNPACYGGWIDEIIKANYIVLFPKFQSGTWLPKTNKFEKRVDKTIELSIDYLKNAFGFDKPDLIFVSHSIGGVISANLADIYGKTSEHKVSGLLLVQPGHKAFRLGSKETYENINSNTKIVCVTGNKDKVASNNFTQLILSTTSQISYEHKLWINQFEYQLGESEIGSSHSEPISIDKKFDSGQRNLVVSGSFIKGKTDEVDRNCYWRLTNLLLEKASIIHSEFDKNSENLISMGYWGQLPIKPLEVKY